MSAALQSLMRAPSQPVPRHRPCGVLPFLGIGAAGAAALVTLSSALIWLQVSYAVLILPVYLLHHRFSFASRAGHEQALPRYMAVQGLALLLAAGFSYGAHELLALPTLLASIAVTGLTASGSYLLLRGWAFAHRPGTTSLAV